MRAQTLFIIPLTTHADQCQSLTLVDIECLTVRVYGEDEVTKGGGLVT